MKFMIMLHVLGIVIWVGGMFFAHQVLRPVAADLLEPPLRLQLWVGVFRRFFPWVWVCVAAVLGSGLFMIMLMGGMKVIPLYVHAMLGLGLIMMAIFAHVFFAPYARLKKSVENQDWKTGGASLANIRQMVGINLSLGLLTIALATAGALLA
ncbi:MAG: CopD family protein [Gammaproteobacteria bacterium]|nr:CopD family protein [Gammaproteobacteria bacterium]MBU1733401.1 CopD family protein [Gammaproteobacteria bacterium]MBU1891818.1 CopD family protein [Gammaproteobacteria bacterium]